MSAPPKLVRPSWTLADRLRKIRRDVLKVEQREIAEQLGVGAQAYSAWESGRTRPRDVVVLARQLEAIAGVPAEWTLGLHDEPAPAAGAGGPSKLSNSACCDKAGQRPALRLISGGRNPAIGCDPVAQRARRWAVRVEAA